MYRPKAFDVTDLDEIHRAIDAAGPAHADQHDRTSD